MDSHEPPEPGPQQYPEVMLRARLILVVALSLVEASAQYTAKEMTFPSGRRVKIIDIQQIETKDDAGRWGWALCMQYETKLKITDSVALNKEIDEIWKWLKVDASYRRLTEAIIQVLDPHDEKAQRTFSFTQTSDGSWRRQNPSAK
jgi:hypothetical protein